MELVKKGFAMHKKNCPAKLKYQLVAELSYEGPPERHGKGWSTEEAAKMFK